MKKPKRTAAKGLVDAIKRFQDSVDLFDTVAARSIGVNATDLRCLAALSDHGPMNARAVAQQLGLTRGATTTALDRLQERLFITRSPEALDGRGIIIELAHRGRACVENIWGPMRRDGGELLSSYSLRELQLLQRFFDRSSELQLLCTERLRPHRKASEATKSRVLSRADRAKSDLPPSSNGS